MPVRQEKILYLRTDFLKVEPSQKPLKNDNSPGNEVSPDNSFLSWVKTNIKSKNIIDQNSEFIAFGWWVEIFTIKPICLYYFGPFDQRLDAENTQNSYIEDLQDEGSDIISAQTKRCQPRQLTLSQIDLKPTDFRFLSSLFEVR